VSVSGVRGSFLGGWGGQWEARGGGSAANRRAPELEEMAVAELRDGVARAREGQGGEARAALGLGATRGVARNWRWRRGAAEAEHMAGKRR
jgi:hypothetical protein